MEKLVLMVLLVLLVLKDTRVNKVFRELLGPKGCRDLLAPKAYREP